MGKVRIKDAAVMLREIQEVSNKEGLFVKGEKRSEQA
jgi:hypothetical protein